MSRTGMCLGPPGTGKTTHVLKQAEEELAKGTDPKAICLTSFTRQAAYEAKDRARRLFNLDDEQLPYWGTLHSLGFRLLGLTPDQVVTQKHLSELGAALGPYTFAADYNDGTERCNPEGELGDKVYFIYHLHRACLISLEEAWKLYQSNSIRFGPPLVDPFPFHVVEYFVRGLEHYKKKNYLYDFNDFLDECHVALPLELFILDEAQDLTPQQWRFARRLGSLARKVLIACDDDQTIFDWSGADVRYVLRMQANRYTLPISHRLPQAVFELVTRVASRIKNRLPKEYSPRPDPGAVQWLSDEGEIDLSKGQWLLMGRTNWLLDRLVKAARKAGVVYQHKGQWSNTDPAIQAVLAYEAMRSGKRIPYPLAQLACRYCEGFVAAKGDLIGWDDVVWPFAEKPDWMTALSRIGVETREYIRRLRQNGESLVEPGRVRISTIHAAKGGEADNVLVLSDLGRRVENHFWADMDSELRVWYVAFSRAKENLFIVQPRQFSALHGLFQPL